MEITNSMKIVLKTKKPEWLKAKTDLKLLDSVFSVCWLSVSVRGEELISSAVDNFLSGGNTDQGPQTEPEIY